MTHIKNLQRGLLLVAGLALIPVAFNYGLNPQESIPHKFGFEITSINMAHIFRALMTLYLGMTALWFLGFFYDKARIPAIYALTFFMLSIASGRVLSILLDGMPSPIFFQFLAAETIFGTLGLILLIKGRKSSE